MPRDLLTPILDEEQRSVHYFNGRILYAEDLRKEQETHRRRHERLGRLHGEGVAWGLEVTPAADGPVPSAVSVQPGVAVNRKGQALHLPRKVNLAVAGDVEPPSREDALFRDCTGETLVPDGLGPYVLLLSPAAEYSERAPFVGIREGGVSRGCGRRFVVEGVQFRLVHLDVDDGLPIPETFREPLRQLVLKESPTEAEASRLRNLLAHWCLGTGSVSPGASRNLYELVSGAGDRDVRYGPLDALRREESAGDARHISDCDVPLALIYWGIDGIRFVDMWAVRRRLHRARFAASEPDALRERRRAEGEAAFLQFQGQTAAMVTPERSAPSLDAIRARDYFRFLPAMGLIPERVGGFGLTHLAFFDGLTVRAPVYMDDTRVAGLRAEAVDMPAMDLEQGELIWLYRVRGNRTAVASSATPPQPYLVFARGQLPYRGDAQFDLSYWNYSNYAPGVFVEAPDQ